MDQEVRSSTTAYPGLCQSGCEVLDPRQLAARLNVPETWVREHTRKRTADPIPHSKLGKYCRFWWGSPQLEAWLERRMVVAHVNKVARSSGKERIQ